MNRLKKSDLLFSEFQNRDIIGLIIVAKRNESYMEQIFQKHAVRGNEMLEDF
jgi:hypothetical protein